MNNKFNHGKLEDVVKDFLIAIGEDPNREGLKDTPRRVADYWEELLEGNKYSNEEIANLCKKEFEISKKSMVMEWIDDVYSHCEHHLALMFDGNVIVGYIPIKNSNNTYNVLGLSKINRIVDLCSKRLQIQEKLATDIAECISIATGSKEVYVNICMKHGCVSARGIKSRGFTNVTYATHELQNNKKMLESFENKAQEMIIRNQKPLQ